VKKTLGAVTEVAVGVAFVIAYVHLSRFLWSLGPRREADLFWIKVLPPAILALVGWWLWLKVWHDQGTAGWRKVVGLVGLIASTLAISIPWVVVYYDLIVAGFDMRRYPRSIYPGWQSVDLYWTFQSCFLVSAVTMALGLAAPRRIRLAVVSGSFATYWLMGTLAVR
jgi:hypothetical protein